ncbi:MAG: exopolysaccharide biosynthesis polyprenyl glycosylphosphotransferase [Candidatus Omnitrophica bacterium]|nr:exopolysaccharide biosynthesis polyprenyl glycosylphosphotransferase [Candidatus Omnitrophota bacterium]
MGIDIDSLTAAEFLQRIDEFVENGAPRQISYLNADCLNKCWSDRSYREAVIESDLVYADGMGVVWASRLFGHPLPERLNANDLLPQFCRRAEEKGHRIFLLGGENGIAEKAKDDLQSKYPNLQIVGCHKGYFTEEESEEVIQKIREVKPDILIVGMGAPKQELWIRRHLKELGVPVAWGVGGLLDYSAKGLRRAPVWMRKSGLEWFWRLCLEPRRLWRRYILGNILFTFRVGFLIFADAVSASLAWFLAFAIRAYLIPELGFLPDALTKQLNPFINYVIALPMIIITWITICASLDLYRRQSLRTSLEEMSAIVKMTFLFLITSMAVAFLLKDLSLGRSVLTLSSVLAFMLMLMTRLIWSGVERSLFEEGIGRVRTLIVGTDQYVQKAIDRLQSDPSKKYEILGILDDAHTSGECLYGQPILGKVNELPTWAKTLAADEIFFADPQLDKRSLLNLVASCGEQSQIRQYNILTDLFGVITDNAFFDAEEDIPFKVLKQGGLSPFEQSLKRFLDIGIAGAMLLCTLPFFPIICILIRLSSKGPAIFHHNRIGVNGQPFIMYKFRTMYQEVNEYQEAPIRVDDPRILPIGRLLRRTSLDELPQLFNVLKGEMSMVGPRPEMPFIVDKYEPWQRRRLTVLPGITGLWQISGRKDLPLHSNLEYDFYYIQNQTLLFDVIILLKTIPVVLFGKGAY